MKATHIISAVYWPQRNEVEATWKDIETGKEVAITFPVTPEQGEDLAEIVWPCVYHPAICVDKK